MHTEFRKRVGYQSELHYLISQSCLKDMAIYFGTNTLLFSKDHDAYNGPIGLPCIILVSSQKSNSIHIANDCRKDFMINHNESALHRLTQDS
jgi:hypothetical protein